MFQVHLWIAQSFRRMFHRTAALFATAARSTTPALAALEPYAVQACVVDDLASDRCNTWVSAFGGDCRLPDTDLSHVNEER